MSPRGLFLLVLFALTLIGGGSHAPRADAADLNVLVVDDPADDAEAGAPEITQVTVAHNEAGNVVLVRVWVAGGTDLAADRGIALSFDQDLDGGTGCIPPIRRTRGHDDLVTTARSYTHVVADERELDYAELLV